MPVTRTYGCDECGLEWTVRHTLSSDPYPDCPACAVIAQWRPQAVAINGIHSKAIDVAQGVAESMGLTNIRNTKPGETAFDAPAPIQTAEAEKIIREMKEAGIAPEAAPHLIPQINNYWQGVGGVVDQTAAAATQGAFRDASGFQTANRLDPVSLVGSESKAPKMKLNVMGSAEMKIAG